MFQLGDAVLTNKKIRVCLFGSYYTGYEVLSALLELSKKLPIELVGVVSDNPYEAFSNPKKRFWQYGHTAEEASMVLDLAKHFNIPTWNGRVKNLIKDQKTVYESSFPETLKNDWAPDVIYMAAFGQRITQPYFFIYRQGATTPPGTSSNAKLRQARRHVSKQSSFGQCLAKI